MPEVDEFLQAASGLARRYEFIDVRAIVVKSDQLGWVAIGLSAVATSEPRKAEGVPNGERVRALAEVLPISELPVLARAMAAGEMELQGSRFKLLEAAGAPERPANPHAFFEDRRRTRATKGDDWPSQAFATTVNLQGGLNKEAPAIDAELMMHAPPFFGLDDLQRNFLQHKNRSSGGYWGELSLRVPFPARIAGEPEIRPREAIVEIEFLANRSHENMHVVCIAETSNGSVSRERQVVEDVPLVGGKTGLKFPLPSSARAVRIGLLVDERQIDSYTWETHAAFSGPARLAALDLNLSGDKLEKELRTARGRHLENAVALAFHAAGFAPAAYGVKGSEADLVVFPPRGKYAFVVECTEGGTSIKSKVEKLAIRTNALEARIDGTARGILVCRDESELKIASVTETASHDAIALISIDHVLEMLDKASHGDAPRDIYEFIKERVPERAGSVRWARWD